MSTISCRILSSPILSSYELAKATGYLASTRDSLLEALDGLSDSQWHFTPAPDRWSVADILEHLVLIEDGVQAVVGRMQYAPPAEPDRVNSQVEEFILAEVPQRFTKLKAPPQVSPSRQWNPAEALARFRESRTRTLELLIEASSLRGHVVPHPFRGVWDNYQAWDGYQWILATAAHTARHTDQILEVRACSGFPETQIASSVSLH